MSLYCIYYQLYISFKINEINEIICLIIITVLFKIHKFLFNSYLKLESFLKEIYN